jgi:hypothetical protein
MASKPQAAVIFSLKATISAKNYPAFLALFTPQHKIVAAEPECVFFLTGQKDGEEGKKVVWWSEGWSGGLEWFMTVCSSHFLS